MLLAYLAYDFDGGVEGNDPVSKCRLLLQWFIVNEEHERNKMWRTIKITQTDPIRCCEYSMALLQQSVSSTRWFVMKRLKIHTASNSDKLDWPINFGKEFKCATRRSEWYQFYSLIMLKIFATIPDRDWSTASRIPVRHHSHTSHFLIHFVVALVCTGTVYRTYKIKRNLVIHSTSTISALVRVVAYKISILFSTRLSINRENMIVKTLSDRCNQMMTLDIRVIRNVLMKTR